MSHSIQEARYELSAAATFGRRPAEWAVAMVDQVQEAGGGGASRADAAAPGVDDFKRAGLCEESAVRAERGLAAGRYSSFEDAAIAQTAFDVERRNLKATPARIADTARQLRPAAAGTDPARAERLLTEVADLAVSRLGHTAERAPMGLLGPRPHSAGRSPRARRWPWASWPASATR